MYTCMNEKAKIARIFIHIKYVNVPSSASCQQVRVYHRAHLNNLE